MSHRIHAQALPAPAAPCPRRSASGDVAPYLEDASGFTGHAEAVLLPEDEAQVGAILREAVRTGTAVTVSGAGTGLTGGRVPQGGWVLSLEKFNRILELAPGRARVGSALLLKQLQAAAIADGQFYPPDPTEIHSSLGGNVACNASGSRSFKYGSTRRWVRRLRIVLPNGELLDVARGQCTAERNRFEIVMSDGTVREIRLPDHPMPATTKHSAGYWFKPGMDLVDLFIGSEGTLGVVTEIEVALLPWPGDVLGGVIFFSRDPAALDFIARVRALSRESNWQGPVHARLIEYFDDNSLELLRINKYPELPRAATAAVLLEQEIGDGSREDAAEQWLAVIAQSGNPEHSAPVGDRDALLDDSWFAISPAEREKFREFRHSMALIVLEAARLNGYPKLGTDQAVPPERTEDIIAYYRRELEAVFGGAHPPQYTIYGHIGDGHLHVNMLPTNDANFGRAKEMLLEFAKEAVRMGGTVGAEHGLGKSKSHFLPILYPPEVIDAMRQMKLALDAHDLLNRGNLFSATALLQTA